MLMFLFFSFCTISSIVFAESELLSVHVVVRHGARAPIMKFTSNEAQSHFYRGLEQLTDQGIEQADIVGEILRDRYINTSFLDRRMLPSENFFRSSPSERCLMTINAIANKMYPEAVPPIQTEPKTVDFLLVPRYFCSGVLEFYRKEFNLTNDEINHVKNHIWEISNRALFRAAKNTTLLQDKTSFDIPALILEKDAGVAVPSWFNDTAYEEAEYLFYSALSAISGAGNYFNADLIRSKSGFLLYTIQENIKKMIECHKDEKCVKPRKFQVFSTHDIVILSLLEALGVRAEALGELKSPEFCALTIIELWLVDNEPKIKVFYRRKSNDKELTNLSRNVRNCDKNNTEFCDSNRFLNCCQQFVTSNPEVSCFGEKSEWKFNPLSWTLLAISSILLILVLLLSFFVFQSKRARQYNPAI